jgi:isopenicillin N synthase-like dioxygenase
LYGDKPNEHIKLIRYPGQQETQSHQGVGAHKDSGFLSFLLQDEQKGLQVEVAPGQWIDATAGRQLCGQYWRTAGAGHQRLSARHRPSGGVSAGHQQRLSIAFSSAPSWMPWCRSSPCRPSWRGSARTGQRPANPLLRDVGWNYLKGRLRSHPDVAERYYQDVFRERAEQLIV